jgi:hypothetical protein
LTYNGTDIQFTKVSTIVGVEFTALENTGLWLWARFIKGLQFDKLILELLTVAPL